MSLVGGGQHDERSGGPREELRGNLPFHPDATRRRFDRRPGLETLFDAHAIGVYECSPRGKLADIPAGEAAIETLLKYLLQTRHRDERVFRTLIADDAVEFSFDWWQHHHVPIVTYN